MKFGAIRIEIQVFDKAVARLRGRRKEGAASERPYKMKSGCLWLSLYFIAIVPAAVFGASMAGVFVYQHDGGHGGHGLRPSNYYALLHLWEAVSGITCGLSGFLLVGWSQIRKRQKDAQERAATRRTTGDGDGTVWPPPPRE